MKNLFLLLIPSFELGCLCFSMRIRALDRKLHRWNVGTGIFTARMAGRGNYEPQILDSRVVRYMVGPKGGVD